ncbi:MAG: ABC transporter ATP-binding protein [Bradymonadales bacterium]|nr:ABC transporter ATP-binding protein [Bradymonadales bacterium]
MQDVEPIEERPSSRRFDPRLILWLLSFARREYRVMVLAVSLLLVSTILGMLAPYLTKLAIDRHILQQDLPGLAILCGAFLILELAAFGTRYLQVFLMTWIGQRIMARLRVHILDHCLHLSRRTFDQIPTGRLMTRVTSDVDALNELLTSGMMVFVSDVVMLAAIVVALLLIHAPMALAVYALLPLVYWALRAFRKRIAGIYRTERELIGRINSTLQENLSGMNVIQLYNRQQESVEAFNSLNERYFDNQMRAVRAHATFFPLMSFLGILAKAIIVWYGGALALQGSLTIGEMVAFIGYVELFFGPLRDMSEKYNIFQAAMAASEKIKQILGLPTSDEYTQSGSLETTMRGEVAFEHVWFAYDADQWVLRDVSFTISAGETLAIVGQTGSGKTTLINLLARFYQPQQGRIRIDGADLEEWSIDSLRSQISLVPQEVFLFSDSLKENITLFEEEVGDERIEEILKSIEADRIFAHLPDGLHTRLLEGGKSLSSGQRQLLAFARTLYRDPPILVLDEATANIDTETEQAIQVATSQSTRGRTAIVIAHRLSTIKNADRIVVLHRGEVREIGTHQELLEKKGIYRDLYELQFAEQERRTGKTMPPDRSPLSEPVGG